MKIFLLFLLLLTGQNVFSFNTQSSAAANSVLATGRWIKAQTNQQGMHKITFAALKSMGLQSPQKVKIFGFPPGQLPQMNSAAAPDDLIQYRTWQTKDNQENDCFMIYVPGVVTWRFDPVSKLFIHDINQYAGGRSFLYLTEDITTDQPFLVTYSRPENPSEVVTESDVFSFYEKDEINLIESGSRWFTSLIAQNTTLQQTFKFLNHINSEPISITVAAAGRCDFSSSVSLSVNNSPVGTMNFSPYANYAEADYANLKEGTFSTVMTWVFRSNTTLPLMESAGSTSFGHSRDAN
jgi:hypothetical protein